MGDTSTAAKPDVSQVSFDHVHAAGNASKFARYKVLVDPERAGWFGMVPKRVRFCRALEHYGTRPGFQAPWGSHDPHAKIPRGRVFWPVLTVALSTVLFAELATHFFLPEPPMKGRSKEWWDSVDVERKKLEAEI